MLLVNSQFRENHIKLEDACAHCSDRIYIEAKNGVVTQVSPEETVIHRGGT